MHLRSTVGGSASLRDAIGGDRKRYRFLNFGYYRKSTDIANIHVESCFVHL
ncbi:hypothetical protein COO91_08452 [Nostoc flagelliforme CCNUN1]|uniref:Uncharacterized protein n=1 Tax=Nostoc flagelliforme CCNUN1 TaxID=2038116 RepID=A0A2K8T3U4_9NOSO|nr:hypothetical protein COO91_08452 [Nostoc flagelliforme CCNUN1]